MAEPNGVCICFVFLQANGSIWYLAKWCTPNSGVTQSVDCFSSHIRHRKLCLWNFHALIFSVHRLTGMTKAAAIFITFISCQSYTHWLTHPHDGAQQKYVKASIGRTVIHTSRHIGQAWSDYYVFVGVEVIEHVLFPHPK